MLTKYKLLGGSTLSLLLVSPAIATGILYALNILPLLPVIISASALSGILLGLIITAIIFKISQAFNKKEEKVLKEDTEEDLNDTGNLNKSIEVLKEDQEDLKEDSKDLNVDIENSRKETKDLNEDIENLRKEVKDLIKEESEELEELNDLFQKKSKEQIKEILEMKNTDELGNTLLHETVLLKDKYKASNILDLFDEYITDLNWNVQNNNDQTILHIMAEKHDGVLIKHFNLSEYKDKFDISITDSNKNTAEMIIKAKEVLAGQVDITKFEFKKFFNSFYAESSQKKLSTYKEEVRKRRESFGIDLENLRFSNNKGLQSFSS